MSFLDQAVNVTLEAMGANIGLVVVAFALLAVAWGYWLVKARPALKQHMVAVIVALLISVVGFFIIPSLVHSGLGDMVYWLDWAFHLTTIFVLFVYSYVVCLPIFSAMKK